MKLYYDILESNGLILSEYEPNQQANSKKFLQRNRIVSGISLGILVVEAKHRSGTSVTADIATQQGKKVFVLPHEIDDICGVGTNNLIRRGAILITKTKEIIDEFEFIKYKEIPHKKIDVKLLKEQKDKEKDEIQIRKNQEELEAKDKKYKLVYDEIVKGNSSINEISNNLGKEISEVSNVLFMLEIDGYIEKIAGGYKCILSKE